jgi:uncharacterized delta-60 repeat protein
MAKAAARGRIPHRRRVRLVGRALAYAMASVMFAAVGTAAVPEGRVAQSPYVRSFGEDGRVIVRFPGGPDTHAAAYAVAARPNGSLVVGGTFNPPGNKISFGDGSRFAVTQLRADGSVKKSFGSDGRVTTFLREDSLVTAVLPWRRGGMLAAGVAGPRCVVVKYMRNGGLDRSFARRGKLRLPHDQCFVNELIDHGRDAFTLVGNVLLPGADDRLPMVTRRFGDGRPDPAFGEGGTWVAAEPAPLSVQRTHLLRDGKVLVVGSVASPELAYVMAAARYNPDGRLDTTFGANGLFTTGDLMDQSRAERVTELPDGGFVLGGEQWPGGHEVGIVSLVKADKTGALDTSFGDHGVARPATGYYDGADIYDMVTLPDGRVVAVGEVDDGDGPIPYLSILTRKGRPDRTFAPRGLLEIKPDPFQGGRWGIALAVTLDSRKLFVAGIASGGMLLAAVRPG